MRFCRRKERHRHIQNNNKHNGRLKEMIRIAKRAAESDLPVFIMGESGTGKELFA
ncbi:hypothetical protein GK1413 [Geobacillus kaustophilus HTA426]|nr:hypothetical protein GA8_17170 [Geobacillus sp. A8]BAD75698.1 hypothetical protein GK1413 [Geobacillus kaustophilus HTA426]